MIRIPKVNQLDCVRVHWSDPSALPGVWDKPSAKNMRVDGCITVGMVYRVHEDRITVMCTWDTAEKHANGGMTIPFSLISKFEVLAR